MSEATVRTILRLVAVVTILVGTTMVTMDLVAYAGASRAIHGAMRDVGGNLTGVVAEFGFVSLLSQAVIAAEGFLLYFLSPVSSGKSGVGRSGKSGAWRRVARDSSKSSPAKTCLRELRKCLRGSAAQAEDRALLGSNSSADLGAKTGRGREGWTLSPSTFPGIGTRR